jgi:hypothetical protein
LRTGNDQGWQEAHDSTVPAAQFKDQSPLQTCQLNGRRCGAVSRQMTKRIRHTVRIDNLSPNHESTPAYLTDERNLILNNPEICLHALAHRSGVAGEVPFLDDAKGRKTRRHRQLVASESAGVSSRTPEIERLIVDDYRQRQASADRL